MKQFISISDLTNAGFIETLTGPVQNIERTSLRGTGFSASVLERIDVHLKTGSKNSFILKHTLLGSDWLSQRTNDTTGREAAILMEEGLLKTWECFDCPYLAFAMEKGKIALLMNDLSDYLFPDVREPIDSTTEVTILDALASFHACFWESPVIKGLDWLVKSHQYLLITAPGNHPSDSFAPPPPRLSDSMKQGWRIASELLRGGVESIIFEPAKKTAERWKDLPITFLHGDPKIANMALMPDGRLAVFDWALAGRGPCGIDLGWYIAVNATRLARTKDEIISLYRAFLESHLHYPIEEEIWTRMVDFAVLAGAKMLLWSKALGYLSGTERGRNEWEWWTQKLKTVAEKNL